MIAKDLRIVFMGTPEFAVPSLRYLAENGYNVVGVVTTPDRTAGRGQKIYECDVKVEAQRLGLPILQPEKLRDPDFLEALGEWQPDLGIVIAFRMLPREVWAMPRLGTFNLHASLLPEYRGAAPINHAIINGDKESGITTFLLNEKIDQGAIIAQEKVAIGEKECVGELYERLMNLGPKLVEHTVELLAAGDIKATQQQHIDENTLRPAPKIFKNDCEINWSWEAERIHNFVRGLSPYPAAWSTLRAEGKESITLKIFEVEVIDKNGLTAGQIESNNKDSIIVGCGTSGQAIAIKSLQLAGKKRLNTKDLLLGFKNIKDYTL